VGVIWFAFWIIRFVVDIRITTFGDHVVEVEVFMALWAAVRSVDVRRITGIPWVSVTKIIDMTSRWDVSNRDFTSA
jgi:hypothetical protein